MSRDWTDEQMEARQKSGIDGPGTDGSERERSALRAMAAMLHNQTDGCKWDDVTEYAGCPGESYHALSAQIRLRDLRLHGYVLVAEADAEAFSTISEASWAVLLRIYDLAVDRPDIREVARAGLEAR